MITITRYWNFLLRKWKITTQNTLKGDILSAKDLLDMINTHDYLRQDFYIPITVVIMCFVNHKSGNWQLPKTLCKICVILSSPLCP